MKKSRLYSVIDIILFVAIAVGYFLPFYNGSRDNMIKSMGEAHMIIGFVLLLIGLIGCIFNKKELGYLPCGYFLGIQAYFYMSMHANPQIHLSLKQIGIGVYVQFFPAFLAFMVTLISSFKASPKAPVAFNQGPRNNAQVSTTVNNGQMNMPVNNFQSLPVEQKEKEKTMPKPDLLAGTKVDNSSMFVNPSLMEPETNNNDLISKPDMSLFKQVNIMDTSSNSQPIAMNELGPTPTLNIPTSQPLPEAPAPETSAPAATQSMPTDMMGGGVVMTPPAPQPATTIPVVSTPVEAPAPEAPAPAAMQSMPTDMMGGGVVMTPPQAPSLAPVPEAPVPAAPQSMPTDMMGGGVVMTPPQTPSLAPVPEAPVPAAPQSMPTDMMGGGVVMTPPQTPSLAPVPAISPVPEVPVAMEAPQSMPTDLLGPTSVVEQPVQEAPTIPPIPTIPEVPTTPAVPTSEPSAMSALPTPSKEGGQDISSLMNQGPSMEEQIKAFNEQQAASNNAPAENIPKPDLLAGSNMSGILGN